MERLNEIMGRTMPRRSSHPTRQLHPDQGPNPALPGPQAEAGARPLSRRRLPEQASLPADPSTRPDATYPYSNGTPSRPNQQYYANTARNQRQSYEQATAHNRFNGPENYIRPAEAQGESEGQTFTQDVYPYNRSATYPAIRRTSQGHDGDMAYTQAQMPTQQRQNYPGYQPRQEQYLHHADVSYYMTQPEGDVLYADEIGDDEELYMMRDGDWEETVSGPIEQPTPLDRPIRNVYDIRNGAANNKRSSSSYRAQTSMEQPQVTHPSQRYSGQPMAALPPAQPTPHTAQGLPTQSGQQGRSQQSLHAGTYEREVLYNQRITQPLSPQTITDLSRQREYALQLNQARMRQTDAPQQVPALPQPEHKEIQTGARPYHAQPARQVSQAQTARLQAATFVPNKSLCTRCKGAGYLRANVPFGHPNFGKAIACECKEAERKEKRRQQLREMSNLDAFRQKTFSTFNAQMSGVREAYQAALEFETRPKGWLVFSGPNGCGKTHLAAAIANQALDNGAVVLFEATPDLLDHLRAAFAPAATEVYDQLFSKMREAELLILDDLGAQQSSPWANEKLFQLLNYRYNLSMATVITGNPKGIQGVDERIRSRLSDTGLVRTIMMDRARDYRPQNAQR